MAIQELNANEIDLVAGAGLFGNLGNGGLNPVNGVTNLLTNFNPGTFLQLLVAGVVGLLANPFVLFEAVDVSGIVAVLVSTVQDELNGLGL